MTVSFLNDYLLVVNIISFILYGSNKMTDKRFAPLNGLLGLLTILGGAAGALFCLLLFDRKIVKEDLMMRVLIVCMFSIQVILLLMTKAIIFNQISFNIHPTMFNHQWMSYYLVVINVITLVLFASDKLAALKKRDRVPNLILLGCAFIGGTPGTWLGIYLFRHKVKKNYYVLGIPLIFVS